MVFSGSLSATLTKAVTIAVNRLVAALGLKLPHASELTWADPGVSSFDVTPKQERGPANLRG